MIQKMDQIVNMETKKVEGTNIKLHIKLLLSTYGGVGVTTADHCLSAKFYLIKGQLRPRGVRPQTISFHSTNLSNATSKTRYLTNWQI